MGGPSAEREVSLNTGAAIANALREYGYTNVVEIDLDPRNFGKQLAESKAEVVFNAVHGLYGEDGRLQTLLEIREMPYTAFADFAGNTRDALYRQRHDCQCILHGQGYYQTYAARRRYFHSGLPDC